MTLAMDDLLAEDMLTFTPRSGSIEIDKVAGAIAGIGFPYRDEADPSVFALFSDEAGRTACRDARRADPASPFPFVPLITVRPEVVVLYQQTEQSDLLALSAQFITWLTGAYDCRIKNEFNVDMADRPPREPSAPETEPASDAE